MKAIFVCVFLLATFVRSGHLFCPPTGMVILEAKNGKKCDIPRYVLLTLLELDQDRNIPINGDSTVVFKYADDVSVGQPDQCADQTECDIAWLVKENNTVDIIINAQ